MTRGDYTVFTLGRPAPAPCQIAQCAEVGDITCDLCGLQACPGHSFHLLMAGPWQRRAAHKIVCPSCADSMKQIAADDPEQDEELAVIPRASVAELDRELDTYYLEEWRVSSAHGR